MNMCKRRSVDMQFIRMEDIGVRCYNDIDPDRFSLVGSNINIDMQDILKL